MRTWGGKKEPHKQVRNAMLESAYLAKSNSGADAARSLAANSSVRSTDKRGEVSGVDGVSGRQRLTLEI